MGKLGPDGTLGSPGSSSLSLSLIYFMSNLFFSYFFLECVVKNKKMFNKKQLVFYVMSPAQEVGAALGRGR